MTPYFERDGITIYHADCREVLPGLAADVLVTDPPYGIAHVSGQAGKIVQGVAGDDSTILRDAVLAMWGERPALVFGTWKIPHPASTRTVLIWDKGAGVGMGDLSLPWKPNWEEIYVLGGGFVGHRGSGVIRSNGPGAYAQLRDCTHPTAKSVAVMTILLHKCPANWTILDPFMGSGTTLRAALDLGRKAIGIEIEERYCEIAARRLDQMAMRLDDAPTSGIIQAIEKADAAGATNTDGALSQHLSEQEAEHV